MTPNAPRHSPTSLSELKGYRDERSTREPPKLDQHTGHEYQRAARSALSAKLGWHPLDRQLATIRDRPIKRPLRRSWESSKPPQSSSSKPPQVKDASTSSAPQRKPTKPARPSSYIPKVSASRPKTNGSKPWRGPPHDSKKSKPPSKPTRGSRTYKGSSSSRK